MMTIVNEWKNEMSNVETRPLLSLLSIEGEEALLYNSTSISLENDREYIIGREKNQSSDCQARAGWA